VKGILVTDGSAGPDPRLHCSGTASETESNNCHLLAKGLRSNTFLRTIALAGNLITFEACQVISEALKDGTTVCSIDSSDMTLATRAAKCLLKRSKVTPLCRASRECCRQQELQHPCAEFEEQRYLPF